MSWYAGECIWCIPLFFESACIARSDIIFQGGWKDVTSKPCKLIGDSSFLTGLVAINGTPCIRP
jgi:hypothetical protein